METKHTKGKWVIYEKSQYGYMITDIKYPNGKWIAEAKGPHVGPSFNEAEANAKLIAAAPELLENLIRIIDRIEEANLQDNFPSAYNRAKQAIKKATE